VDVDYSGFRNAYGGDFGSRLRLVRLPQCVLSTPRLPQCQVQTAVVGAVNSVPGSVVSADGVDVDADRGSRLPAADGGGAADGPPTGPADRALMPPASPLYTSTAGSGTSPRTAAGASTVYAVTSSSSSSPAGDFSRTPLSASYSWAAGDQGGSFATSIALPVPPALGGPAPQLALTYDSGRVDGRTFGANGQASWIGEGWDLDAGYIEHSFHSCTDEGENIADLCDANVPVLTMVLNGRSTRIVADASWVFHAEADDRLKIEDLRGASNGDALGEYWKVTDLSGTQYFFGYRSANDVQSVLVFGNNPGEPCWSGSVMVSGCYRGYRFNLDYVVDARGNSMTYHYGKFVGLYGALNNALVKPYDLASYLDHIDYGTRAGSEGSGPAPMRVQFTISNRCLRDSAGNCTSWPDTPWDQYCYTDATSCPHLTSPAFWTPYRPCWLIGSPVQVVSARVDTGDGARSRGGRLSLSRPWKWCVDVDATAALAGAVG
jgi:hypothetical protein